MVDRDTALEAVVEEVSAEVRQLWERVSQPGQSLAEAEQQVWETCWRVGGRVLEVGLAARGRGYEGARRG